MSETGKAMELNKEETERTASTQRNNFEHIAESRSMEHEVEGYRQLPSSLPPPYSDVSAGEAQTSQTPKNSVGSDATDSKNDVNGRCEPLILYTAPLDPEIPNRRWQWSKYFPTNRRKVAQHVLKVVTILVSISFILHVSIQHRNKSESHFHNGASNVGCSGSNGCPGSTHKINATYDFTEPSEFSLIEKVQGGSNYPSSYYEYVRTEGEIHVRPATEHLDTNLRVHITIHGSNPELMHLNSLEKTGSTLVIETLNHIKRDFSRNRPSIYINATIFVAPGTVLQNFGIDTQSLAIIFHPDLDYTVKDSITLSTISRPIRMPTGSSRLLTTTRTREIIIHSSSGSVTGAYPLYDLLSITTLSGSITISYVPKNSSDLNPKPASLLLSTSSASIRATTPTIHSSQPIPNRDYKNDVSTASGSITATLLHSSQTSLRTASGQILAAIHPHGSLSTPSLLSTDSTSGSTTVTVHNSLSHPSSSMRALSASHHFISGSLKLSYPSQWQGRIFGETVSGSLNIHWHGVTVIKDHKKWTGGREIEAERGEGGEARLDFGGVSGSAVLIGKN